MTITQIVLACLNIIAAGVMFWFASQSYVARVTWENYLRQVEAFKTGKETGEWAKELKPEMLERITDHVVVDETFLSALPSDVQRRVKQLSDDKKAGDEKSFTKRVKSDSAKRLEIAKQFQSLGMVMQRDANGKVQLIQGQKDSPRKLYDGSLENLAKELGPVDFTRLVRIVHRQQLPRLAGEEDRVANIFLTNRRIRDSLLDQRERLDVDIDLLTKRRDFEKVLVEEAEYDNLQRQREITRLQSELDEFISSRNITLGRETDVRRKLEEMKRIIDETTKKNSELEQKIEKKVIGN